MCATLLEFWIIQVGPSLDGTDVSRAFRSSRPGSRNASARSQFAAGPAKRAAETPMADVTSTLIMGSVWLWVGFNIFVLALLALDLGVFHRTRTSVTAKEAALWSGVWVALALTFNAGIYFYSGPQPGLEFLTGYLIEKALSVDNIFVFLLVFSYFRVPPKYQHRVLFWGVVGALLMRGGMIVAGSYLIARFHWIIYLFGAFLVITAIRMATQDERAIEPEANPVIRLVRRLVPVTNTYHGQHFFVRENSRWTATPLFIVLVSIEFTDLVFAVDSIPAIFAVTQDPFLVYTSNVFAILGLRSLYFLLADWWSAVSIS